MSIVDIQNLDYNHLIGEWYDWDTAVSETLYGRDYWNSSGDDSNSQGKPLVLYQSGCEVPEGSQSINNCTQACMDPSAMWQNGFAAYTLHNCMTYPLIVDLWRNNRLSENGRKVAAAYAIDINQTSPLIMEWRTISSCTTAFCSQNEEARHSKCGNVSYANSFATNGLGFTTEICTDLDAAINTDIGGIGIFASYLIQILIVLVFWVHYKSLWLRSRILPNKGLPDKEKLRATMKDFQKAQAFFMLGVQIAALIAIYSPAYLEANSMQQWWNNIGILFIVAFGGCMPVLLILLSLRQEKQTGWKTLVLSFSSVVVAATTWFSLWTQFTSGFHKDPLNTIKSEGPPECGNISPNQWCYSVDYWVDDAVASDQGKYMLIFCLTVVFFILVDNVRVFPKRPTESTEDGAQSNQRRNWFEYIHDTVLDLSIWNKYQLEAPRWVERSASSIKRRLSPSKHLCILCVSTRILVFLVEIAMILLMGVLLYDYGKVLDKQGFTVIEIRKWSLGQVLAITVWFPICVDYLWRMIGLWIAKAPASPTDAPLEEKTSWSPQYPDLISPKIRYDVSGVNLPLIGRSRENSGTEDAEKD